MKRLLTLCAVVLSTATPSLAQDQAVTAAAVSQADCARLMASNASKSADYTPGVDVRGKAVVPADVAGSQQFALPGEIVIDFGLDLAVKYGFDSGGLYSATAGIATVTFDTESGQLSFNGKPLVKDDARAIAKACAMALDEAGQ